MKTNKLIFNCFTYFTVLAAWAIQPSSAANISWIGGDGAWSNPVRWTPLGIPTPADIVYLGNLPGAEEDEVNLDIDSTIAALVITDLMRLNTTTNTLHVNGNTAISGGAGVFGSSSLLFIEGKGFGVDVVTQNLSLTDGGSVFLTDAGILDVADTLSIDSVSIASGNDASTIRLFGSSGASLVNDGDLLGTFNGGLIIEQLGNGLIDLDGISGNGSVLADRTNIPKTEHSTLTINGTGLYDEFNGDMRMANGGTINMNLSTGWTMGLGSLLNFLGDESSLNGSEVTIAGEVKVGLDAQGRINANAVLQETANVAINNSSEIGFHGDTSINGGVFTVGENAEMHFDGPTTVHGGDFSTYSDTSSDGAVRFNGETTWAGNVTMNGVAMQVGDATVGGLSNIQADVFDMDGLGGTVWDFNHILTVGADSIDSTLSNTFDGVMQIDQPFSRLILQLTGSLFDKWTMNGEMDLAGSIGPGAPIRIAGSTMRVTGELNTKGRVRIAANAEFGSGGEFNFADDESTIMLEAESLVEAGAMFIGYGLLQNQPSGYMTLADGATLDDVGLVNEGLLEVGDSPGVASVDRFESTADATWLVEIGGYVAGTEHDLLIVSDGPTMLDGLLEVDLIDAGIGGGLFLPEIGDEFTIMTSVSNITGVFLDEPVSFAAGHSYQWEVVYDPHEVTLRLVEIGDVVPEPTAMTIALGCCCLAAGIGRHCRKSGT